jgi:hypothetical protein
MTEPWIIQQTQRRGRQNLMIRTNISTDLLSTLIGCLLVSSLLASCGGGGSSGGSSGSSSGGSSGGGGGQSTPPGILYVDTSGTCGGRTPCYTTIGAAIVASYQSQFEVGVANVILRHKRPNDPPDEIVVMPGTHKSTVVGRFVVYVGLNGEEIPPGIWKLRITAEQGPALTTISGDGTGPCIWIKDYVDIEIKGFTISGCAIANSGIVNEQQAIFIHSFARARVLIEKNRIVSNPTIAAVGIHPVFSGFDQVQVEIVRNEMSGNHQGVLFDSFPVIVRPADVGQFTVANNTIIGSPTSVAPYLAKGISVGPETIIAAQNLHIDIIHNTIVGFRDIGLFVNTDAGEMNVQNNIVFGNRIDIYGGTARTNSNLVGETSNLYVTGNRVGDPLFADPANGNYGLPQLSPAIDAAVAVTNAQAAQDFRGTTRPMDGDRDGTAVADIGALEYIP